MESVSTGIHYRRPLKWAAIEHPHWKRRETDQSPRTDNCLQDKQKKELPPSTPASWWSISLGQQHSSLPGWKKGHNSSSQGGKRDGVNGREWGWRWHVNKSDGILPLYIHSVFPSKLCLLRLKLSRISVFIHYLGTANRMFHEAPLSAAEWAQHHIDILSLTGTPPGSSPTIVRFMSQVRLEAFQKRNLLRSRSFGGKTNRQTR